MKNKLILLLTLTFCGNFLFAQQNSYKKLDGSSVSFIQADSIITGLMQAGNVMAMGIETSSG
jgi:hypothetical protein